MPEQDPTLLLSEQNNSIVYLTLNRPEVLNALNKPLLLEIQKELERIREDRDIRAVVFTGAGDRAFSAGADIEYLNQASPLQVRELARLAVTVTHLIENLNKVSIALINGFALGGGLELAEACMLRIAVDSARFGHPEVLLGAVAGWGGTTRLPRLIGKGRAAEMLLTGKTIDAREALQFGLINRVTEPEKLQHAGKMLLRDIFRNGPLAVNMTWDALHRGLDLSIDESAKLGADYFGLIASTEDFRAGTQAFLQKKKAEFSGE